ncbi:hypothetical protein GCM10010156_48460 [Planobispora rosea]|uniref:Uncharacterized protein n=1 Tax=Planobispora rosea TaxID=35762 RepID=A0A8J3WEZ7_PLARO|nr:hypothetical protein [Planobispora rosea]GGS84192.1 hypothetical protein GCM10010156_48460 [Planobispora rosea]GIH86357.1 hypothetical protein Pro02_47650 [Planobispora rosea]
MLDALTHTDYDVIAAYLAKTAPRARLLEEITAYLDADYHTVWLSGESLWHAWREPGEELWHLDQESAAAALAWLRQQLDGQGVFDRLADPARYAESIEARLLDPDEAAMAEFYDVELAALGAGTTESASPREVDQMIQSKIARARAEVARLASLRAHHVRAAFQGDGARGWKANAARGLAITPVSLGDILADDEARAARRRKVAATADATANPADLT